MDKLTKKFTINLDENLLAAIDAHRRALESHSGLRVSRSNATVSLVRTALTAANGAAPTPAPHGN